MVGNVFIRLFSAVVGSIVTGPDATTQGAITAMGPQLTVAQALPRFNEVLDIRADAPVAVDCDEIAEGCVALPMVVTQQNARGFTEEVPFVLPISDDLVDTVKARLDDVAPIFLRNVHSALAKGIESANPLAQEKLENAKSEVADAIPYKVNPGIEMTVAIEKKVALIGEKAMNSIGKKITVTSGTRGPDRQADAMRTKLELGEDITRLYKHKSAVGDIVRAYRQARNSGLGKAETTAQMADVIERYAEQGVYLSKHQRQGAVDLRTRDFTVAERNMVASAARQVSGVRVMYESTPPHFHLDID
jgi:hypothetical protein